MFNTYHLVRIAAVRAAVPKHEIRLEDELEHYGGSLKKIERIRKIVGMDRRRVCPDGVTASDLCAHAAEAALSAYPEWRSTIDALVFVSQSPDWHLPATACELQHRLSLPRQCAAFDVNQGCTGYIYGLWLGGSLIESGAAKRVLLLVGDAHTFGRDPRNRIVAPVFGDGGSATLLERSEDTKPMHFGLGTDGSGFDAIIASAGKGRLPFVREHEKNAALVADIFDKDGNPWHLFDTYMDGGRVFNFTMDVVPPHIVETMRYAHITADDIDWLILHQANKQIMESIAQKAGVSLKKVPMDSFSKFGNLASASIPAALCDALAGVQHPGRMLLCGYGVGLSWASCLCHIPEWDCAPVLDYDIPQGTPNREETIQRWQRFITGQAREEV